MIAGTEESDGERQGDIGGRRLGRGANQMLVRPAVMLRLSRSCKPSAHHTSCVTCSLRCNDTQKPSAGSLHVHLLLILCSLQYGTSSTGAFPPKPALACLQHLTQLSITSAPLQHLQQFSTSAMVRNGSPSPADNYPLGHSATSPQPQPSKRDKRRNMLAEKLSEMMATFSDNRDSHYRAQLAALQADINLIMKADPYKNEPLEDNGQEASELIAQIMGNSIPTAPSAGTDYVAQCGKYYSRFVDAVNDAMEERDYNLTMLYVRCGCQVRAYIS